MSNEEGYNSQNTLEEVDDNNKNENNNQENQNENINQQLENKEEQNIIDNNEENNKALNDIPQDEKVIEENNKKEDINELKEEIKPENNNELIKEEKLEENKVEENKEEENKIEENTVEENKEEENKVEENKEEENKVEENKVEENKEEENKVEENKEEENKEEENKVEENKEEENKVEENKEEENNENKNIEKKIENNALDELEEEKEVIKKEKEIKEEKLDENKEEDKNKKENKEIENNNIIEEGNKNQYINEDNIQNISINKTRDNEKLNDFYDKDKENLSIKRNLVDLEEYDRSIKIILLGDSSVGKSSLIQRLIKNEFSELPATVAIEYHTYKISINDFSIRMQIWDTAGQEKFNSIVSNYYKGTDVGIFLYSVEKANSFNNVKIWFESLKESIGQNSLNILLGNKSDIEEKKKEVSFEQGENFATENKFYLFREISCKINSEEEVENIMEVFDEIGKYFYNYYRSRINGTSSGDFNYVATDSMLAIGEKERNKQIKQNNKKKKKCCN